MKTCAPETSRNFRVMRDRFERQMADYLKRLGARLGQLREDNGFTQEDAARELQVSLRTVQNWEAGDSLPYRRNLRAAEKLYGLEHGDLDHDGPALTAMQQEQLDRIEEKLDDLLKRNTQTPAQPDTAPPGEGPAPHPPDEPIPPKTPPDQEDTGEAQTG